MKKLLLSTALLLLSFSVIAQLYVKPTSGGQDSYIYVKDQVLFVEQDINLVKNTNNPNTVPSVYLREGAQLIQGPSNGVNQGNGRMSVYQNAEDSDKWTYNYWCSPVNVPYAPVGNNNTRLVYNVMDIQTTTLSNAASFTGGLNGSTPPLTISNRWIYTKPFGWERQSDYVWQGEWGNIPVGMGFTMKGVGNSPVGGGGSNFGPGFEYDFAGRPNNGNIIVAVRDLNTGTAGGEYTLSGNPYPSALDLNRVFYDIDNVEILQFRFWDEDKTKNSHYYSGNAGGYGTWIPGADNPDGNPGDIGPGPSFQAGTYTPPTFSIWDQAGNSTGTTTNGLVYDRRFAPIGQGFLIEPDATLPGYDGYITIKNSHRRYFKEGNNSEFRRPENNPLVSDSSGNNGNRSANAKSEIRLNASFGTSHIRQLVLAFDRESTVNFDRGMDATSPMGSSSDAYLTIGDASQGTRKNLVIETLPYVTSMLVPIAFKLNQQMTVFINSVERINVDFEHAFLYDSQSDTRQLITEMPTNGQNSGASVLLNTGTYEDRFFIVFSNYREADPANKEEVLTVNASEKMLQDLNFFQNNPEQQLEIGNPEQYDIRSANIFDMSGKMVYSQSNLGDSTRFTFPTGNLSEGIYIVMLNTVDNLSANYKITVYNK